jgi:serine/threonine-protein kinase
LVNKEDRVNVDGVPVEPGLAVGQYRLQGMIARGGTAEIYKAYHPRLDRNVVIKLLAREFSQDLDWIRRFQREALLLGRLDHPNILVVHDAGEHEGRPYLVMKYIDDAVTLRSLLTGTPWPAERAFRIVAQIAEALQAAHDKSVVHRDVKPSNVLVTETGQCLVFDFGLAQPLSRRDTETAEGNVVGTPEFMSPEQCRGERVDHRTDIYSLGVVSYQLFSGHVPFTAQTPIGVLMRHLNDSLPPPGPDSPVPPAVHAVISRAMARLPEDRFASAREFAQAMAVASGQTPTSRIEPPLASRPRRLRWRRLQLPAARLLAAGFVGLVAATTSLQWFLRAGAAVEAPPPPVAVEDLSPPQVELQIPPPPEGLLSSPGEAATAVEPSVPKGPPPDRASLAALPGSITVECNLPAVLTLDGKVLGIAPGVFQKIPPGRHLLELDAGQERRASRQVVVSAGSSAKVSFRFDPSAVLPSQRAEAVPTGAAEKPAPVSESPPATSARSRAVGLQTVLWEGYLTDDRCRQHGAVPNHARCMERCLREGARPLFYAKGKLYFLEAIERIEGDRDGVVLFQGSLDPAGRTITVAPSSR